MKQLLLFLLLCGATFAQNRTVLLNWGASTSTGTLTYNVYRLTGVCPATWTDTTGSKLTSTPVSGLTYTDSTVTTPASGQPDNKYCYIVRTFRASDSAESGPSNMASASVPAPTVVVPVAPTGVTATLQ